MSPRTLIFLFAMIGGFLSDVWTKAWAFRLVPQYSAPHAVIDGFLYVDRQENDGAMWSMLQGYPPWVWVAIRGGVFLILLGVYLRSRHEPAYVHLAFGLVLAGALGNVYDNLFNDGHVRDWIRTVWWGWTFPVFNIADSAICVGAGLLLIHFMFSSGAGPPGKARVEEEAKKPELGA